MFDIGWSELLVIAVVALVVIGPKDLPGVIRGIGQAVAKLRRMAGEFQGQFNEALREAELTDLKKSVDDIRSIANPLQTFKDEVRNSIVNAATAPEPPPPPAALPDAAAPAPPLNLTPPPEAPDAPEAPPLAAVEPAAPPPAAAEPAAPPPAAAEAGGRPA